METNETLPAFFVGMKLYAVIYRQTEIAEFTVSKIGKTYLYLEENKNYVVNKETLWFKNKGYSQSNILFYRTKEEIEIRRETDKLCGVIQKYFNGHSPRTTTLEQLRQVVEILGLSNDGKC